MKTLGALIRRNIKMFFNDKGMFFTSLITPMILLVLYATFLGNVYHDSFLLSLPQGMNVSEALINACVGGELISSLLAVSCVTVSFCSNMLMVQDKTNGTCDDFSVTPAKRSLISLGYYIATLVSTLIVCLTAAAICLVYLATQGWYLSVADCLLLLLDVFLLVMFGTALSSLINFFLKTQGQISAVGTIISAGYGFICGAYMPISSFSEGLQKLVSFLPGTYGTSLIRNHALGGVFTEMSNIGFPDEVITGIKDSIDCNLYFFGHAVPQAVMYLIVIGAILIFLGAYVLLNLTAKKRK